MQSQTQLTASSMSISLEAIFGVIAILVALPPTILATMKLIAQRRGQNILPVAQVNQGEFLGRGFELWWPRLTLSGIQATQAMRSNFHLLSGSSPKWNRCSTPTNDLVRVKKSYQPLLI